MPSPAAPSGSSFATVLTPALLLERAGAAVYARAQVLLARGHVLSLAVGPEGVVGEVRGERRKPFRVWISAHGDRLLGGCGCPSSSREGLCEHMVALGLAWLVTRGGTPKPPPSKRVEQEAAPEAPEPERPRTPEALQVWLETHHVTHARREPLASLKPHLPRAFRDGALLQRLGREPLTGVVEGTLKLERSTPPDTRAMLEAAGWRWLRTEAERVRRGLEREEDAAPRPPPTDERLAPLVEALGRARARVREHAVPRVFAKGRPTVTRQERPLLLHVKEPGRVDLVPSKGAPVAARVEVDPRALLDGAPALACPCTPGEEARCVHALTALEAVLDALADPRQARANAHLAERLFVEPGQHLLAALEAATLTHRAREERRPQSRISFRLEGLDTGDPRLRPFLHRPMQTKGGLSKGSPLSWWNHGDEQEARADLSEPNEVQAFALCQLLSRRHDAYDIFSSYSAQRVDEPGLLVLALKLLAHSPRLFVASRLDAPLRVREATLGFSIDETDAGLRIRPLLEGAPVRAEALHPLPGARPEHPWLLLEPEGPRLTLVTVPPEAVPMLDALKAHGSHLPVSARKPLLSHLTTLEAHFPVALPESMEARSVEPVPGLLLRLRPVGEENLEATLRVRPLPEAPPLPPGEGAEVVRGVRGGERVMVRRDLEAERAEAEVLRETLGLGASDPFTLEGAEAALGFLEKVESLQGPRLRVEWEERSWTVSRTPDAAGLRVEVHQGRDWFGVEGGVEVDGERVRLAVLLDALRRRKRYVPLGPGRWLRITEALRERLTPLSELAHPTRHGEEVSAAVAPVLDALEEAGVEVQAPPDWRQLATRIRQAQARKLAVPRGLKAKLRDYQREGFVWMARLTEWGGGGCLADDMGLGKTLQALALLLHRAKAGPALVVAPTSVGFNWVREAERFAPSLRVHSYREAERERLLEELTAGDVLVASYGLLARDVEGFARVAWATLVVDEAQAAKNPDTARAKALRTLQAQARVALTGTPVENRLGELWSLYQIVFPGLLGSREAFRGRFILPIERDKDAQARASLARVVRPFLLRRTKAQVARELPPRIETVVPVVLSEEERRLYEDARLAALARLAEAGPEERFEFLAALTRLRLLACHPRLGDADSPVPSSKLERLLELVAELRAEGGRALVFSQFVKHLALVREALEARGVPLQYLDGQTPAAEREVRVAAFQRGEGDVFLISVKAGGTGLNLTAADHVIHLDPWWNPAVEDQATDRAHRIGQTKPVTVSRLVSEGTIEEAILKLHAEKRELANSLLSEADGAAALSTEQLLALLRFTG
jgi:superfamily II DNA or RNA helicase